MVWSSEGRDRVVQVLQLLQGQLARGETWENDTLPRYLEGLEALLGSIENVYANEGTDVPDDPWTLVEQALLGARDYE